MRGLGTIINIVCILAGGITGLLLGKKMNTCIQQTLLSITGVAVLFLGIAGALQNMFSVSNGKISSDGSIMMIVSLSLGAVIGEIINIDAGVEHFGEWLKQKSGSNNDNSFVSSFVSASCTVCIGAMAVIGSISDGISGDYTVLFAKGILDAIIICIMASSQGKGCIFSAIPVAVFQGSITLTAVFAGSFMPEAALKNLSLVGSVLIFCVGLNLIRDKKIRVANLLPSIVIATIWGFFM